MQMKASDVLKIDNGVPIPKDRMRGISDVIKRLKVGDSFLFPAVKRSGLYSIGKRFNITLAIRLVDDETMVRVWRIK
jgi:hypothetical protein